MHKRLLIGPGEWLAAIGVLLTLLSAFSIRLKNYEVDKIGLAVFFAGVVVEITNMRRRSEEAEKELVSIRTLAVGISDVTSVALRFGTTTSAILDLITGVERDDMGQFVHIRAGEKLLREHMVGFIPSFASHLRELQSASTTVVLREPYFINELLANMKDTLPTGSVWFGVSHLAEGWLERDADPGYYGFAEGMRERSSKGELTVFRIYCLSSESQVDKLHKHLAKEVEANIHVRILLPAQDCPPDMSLIWRPPGASFLKALKDKENPIAFLRSANVEPLCGMRFVTRQHRSLDILEISAPNSTDFESLEEQFVRAWTQKAIPFSTDKIQ
jgi:hypothetical protein